MKKSVEKRFMDAAESILGDSNIEFDIIELASQGGGVYDIIIDIKDVGTYIDNVTLKDFKDMLSQIREEIVSKPLTCPECGKVQSGSPDCCDCGTLFFYSELCSPSFGHPLMQYSGFYRAISNMTDDEDLRKTLKTFVSLGGDLGAFVKGFQVRHADVSIWPIFCYKPYSQLLSVNDNSFAGDYEKLIFVVASLCADKRWRYEGDCSQFYYNCSNYRWLIENKHDFLLPIIVSIDSRDGWMLSVEKDSDIRKVGYSETFCERMHNDETISDECSDLMMDRVAVSEFVREQRISFVHYYSIQIGDISELFSLPVLDQGFAIHRLLEEKFNMLVSEISAIQKRIEADIVQS